MKFLVVRVPKNNEYTYEQSHAVFSGLGGTAVKKSLLNVLKKKEPLLYSFNILSSQQRIYFIIGTKEENIPHLTNQILAQYPNAEITDTQPITYSTPHINELSLAKADYFPIKTMTYFQEVDPLASILSSISRSADPNAVFWFQMILEPASAVWQRNGTSYINNLTKPIEDQPSLSQQEQYKNQINLIQEKITLPGYRAYMRLLANSQENLAILVSSFNIFTQSFGNQFSAKPPGRFKRKKLEEAIQNHKPYGRSGILNTLELSTIWHLPTAQVNIPNIVWGGKLTLDAPENLPVATAQTTEEEKANVTYFGKTEFKNQKTVFGIKKDDRFKHMYIVGKTGTGKSWLIANMAIEDMRKGAGVAILDPHGDLSEIILNYIPKKRINDVCYFNPADKDYAYPLNMLEIPNAEQKELMVSGIISIFHKLYAHSWGPRLEHILRNVLFTLINVEGTTLVDVLEILHNKKYRDQILSKVQDPQITQFWEKEYEKMPDRQREEAISPIRNKVGQFVTSPLIRKIIGQKRSKVKIEDIMNKGKILICDLSSGKIGEDNSALLGSMLITQIQIAAMNRAYMPEGERKPFFLYVDEFQNFATQSFIKILSEARKYKLSLTLANQYINQIFKEVLDAILGNVGSLMCFSLGAQDAKILVSEFGNQLTEEELTNLDKYQMVMRLSIDNQTSQTFQGFSLPLPKNISGHRDKIIEGSRRQFGISTHKIDKKKPREHKMKQMKPEELKPPIRSKKPEIQQKQPKPQTQAPKMKDPLPPAKTPPPAM